MRKGTFVFKGLFPRDFNHEVTVYIGNGEEIMPILKALERGRKKDRHDLYPMVLNANRGIVETRTYGLEIDEGYYHLITAEQLGGMIRAAKKMKIQ